VQMPDLHDPHLKAANVPAAQPIASRHAERRRVQFGDTIRSVSAATTSSASRGRSRSHASQTIADRFTSGGATRREFPANTAVWQAACLNCHDTHAVQGTRRLLREGITGGTGGIGIGSYKLGSSGAPNTASAIEETCYQCHTTSANSVIGTATGVVPDIRSDFNLTRHMPITTSEQKSGVESHDIRNSDFVEDRETLGQIDITKRHAECTDCHNPHRVLRNSIFNGSGLERSARTRPAVRTATSRRAHWRHVRRRAALRVAQLLRAAEQNTRKRARRHRASTAVGSPWVTREYQVCFKCHSDYAYPDDNLFPSGNTRPELGSPGTPSTVTSRNLYTRYTNQAREFQAPLTHKGAPGSQGTDAGAGYNTNNHRSWHPVMDTTGRTTAQRNNASANSWLAPWNANVGNQTMHCTDCHGSNTAGGSITPAAGSAWGPHGSTNNFLLKGLWDTGTGSGQSNALCFKCHSTVLAAAAARPVSARAAATASLHSAADKLNQSRCNWCHVAGARLEEQVAAREPQ